MAKTFVRDRNNNILYSFETTSDGKTHYYAEQIGGTEVGWFDSQYTYLYLGGAQGSTRGAKPHLLVEACRNRRIYGDWS